MAKLTTPVQLKLASTLPSIRDLARALGISHTTVSQALRDKPSVKLATRRRVQEAAKAAGYQRDQLAGLIMSGMRSKRGGAYCGTIAIVDLDGPETRSAAAAAYHREITEGASDRAVELGFKPEIHVMGRGVISSDNYEAVFAARGICGMLLLPVRDPANISILNWSRYAGVYADFHAEESPLHVVCPNHYSAMRMALRELHALGYRRPGIVLEQQEEDRLIHRWGDAYRAYRTSFSDTTEVPVLLLPEVDRESFTTWFRQHDPDVVLHHDARVMAWMKECGASIPETHGFCCLNITKNPDIACAGVDQQPRLIGGRAIEQVVAQLHRNEYGAPVSPSVITVPSLWTNGPTLRAPVGV